MLFSVPCIWPFPTLPNQRIALAWALVAVVLLAGCSSAPKRSDAPLHASAPMASRVTDEQARDVTLHAISLVGTRYRRGGNTPDTGFDCSGLIGYVYRNSAGVLAPRTVAQLSDWGQPVGATPCAAATWWCSPWAVSPRTPASTWARGALCMRPPRVATYVWIRWVRATGRAKRWRFDGPEALHASTQ